MLRVAPRYNGAMSAGYMAMPPLMSASSLLSHGRHAVSARCTPRQAADNRAACSTQHVLWRSVSMASLRVLFGGDENPGFGQAHPIGNVSQPVLYVCGKQVWCVRRARARVRMRARVRAGCAPCVRAARVCVATSA
jgi:hypothetical protein